MKTNNLILTAFLIIGAATLAGAQDKKTPYLTKSLSSAAVKEVNMETSGGSLLITGVDAAEARIEVYVTKNNGRGDNLTKAEIDQQLKENYELKVEVSGGTLNASAKPKKTFRDWKNSLSVSFRAYVPRNVSSNLNTSGGSIRLANLTGEQNFSTSGGSLDISRLTGTVKGQTSGGSIRVDGAKDNIELVTSGGSIHASNCEGNMVLKTSGGSLRFENLKGMIEAKTSGGSINGNDISGELITHTSGGSINLDRVSGSLEASTSAGSAHINMISVDKYVKIDVSSGHVDLQLPSAKGLNLDLSAQKVNAENLSNFSGTKEKDQIKGKLNGGGVPVDVRVSSGNISLEVK